MDILHLVRDNKNVGHALSSLNQNSWIRRIGQKNVQLGRANSDLMVQKCIHGT